MSRYRLCDQFESQKKMATFSPSSLSLEPHPSHYPTMSQQQQHKIVAVTNATAKNQGMFASSSLCSLSIFADFSNLFSSFEFRSPHLSRALRVWLHRPSSHAQSQITRRRRSPGIQERLPRPSRSSANRLDRQSVQWSRCGVCEFDPGYGGRDGGA